MTDFVAFILCLFAWILVRVFGLVLLPWSIAIVIKQRRLNSYLYGIAVGMDILANKAYEPALNSQFGPGFGANETVSQNMARNKRNGADTPRARWWERVINVFDKNHLNKQKI